MQSLVSWQGGSETIETNPVESELFNAVGELLPKIDIPNTIIVENDLGSAYLPVMKRGTFVDKDGHERPSPHFNTGTAINDFVGLEPSLYKECELRCVNGRENKDNGGRANNNKFYRLSPCNFGDQTQEVNVTYGRIGAKPGEMYGPRRVQTPYKPWHYWLLYHEKLYKGYVDESKFLLYETPVRTSCAKKPTTAGEELYQKLLRYAKGVVDATLSDTRVTVRQVRECRRIWKLLGQRKSVKGFNRQLEALARLSPRNSRYIDTFYARSKDDFPVIIAREESLILAMEAVVGEVKTASGEFDAIEVYEATDKQKEQVLNHLSDSLKPLVAKVYRVIPDKQSKRFNSYLKKNGIKNVRQLWHGSKNANWLSIIQNSLLLNPNAPITGKMLGSGIYFAPSSMKSWNYTDYQGTTWARGTSDTAFMGLYAVAYGNPIEVHNMADVRDYRQAELNRRGKNCVHAFTDCGLRNDEIVFYDEDALVLNYIVEFHK